MTTFNRFPDRNRDMQDGFERGVWGKITYTNNGATMTVRGTQTVDEEVVVLISMFGFSYGEDHNSEVFMFAGGSDTMQKYALPMIPRDKQRAWKEGTGGMQHPSDPERALEMNDKRAYMDDPNFATRDGIFEVKDGTLYIRGDVFVDGDLSVAGNIRASGIVQGSIVDSPASVTVPPFEE